MVDQGKIEMQLRRKTTLVIVCLVTVVIGIAAGILSGAAGLFIMRKRIDMIRVASNFPHRLSELDPGKITTAEEYEILQNI